ncbi:MAG: hypothetical protein KF901_09610 [Myxococcales bacterium]|nr:hypothetical protein [Myxococcales bacterium]
MTKKLIWIGLVLGIAPLAGCSSSAPSLATSEAPATSGSELAMTAPRAIIDREAPEAELPRFAPETLAALPTAPWSEAPIAVGAAPAPVVAAWVNAENRSWCAPLAVPAGLQGRASELDGGWMVEFDEPGAPGITAEGEPCARCGRGTLGIAGTAVGIDEMMEAPRASFADGSAAEIVEEEGVASATLAVPGQRCVYQVWSHRGAAHLESVLGELRFVAIPATTDSQMAEILPY